MKTLACVMAVLATTGLAMAAPAFTLPSQIDIEPGQSLDVFVGVTGLATIAGGGAQGMNLYLGTGAPFILSGLNVDTLAGLRFTGNTTGASIDQLSPEIMAASVTTNSGVISVDGDLARITISCSALTPVGTQSILSTYLAEFDVSSDFAGVAAGQATAIVKVVPEPASVLLLLAGLPLLRRRHA